MDKTEILKLRTQIVDFLGAEKRRYQIERDFLQSVLDTMGSATEKDTLESQVAVLTDIDQTLGVDDEH